MVSAHLARVAAVACSVAALLAAAAPRVDPRVHRALRHQGTVNLIVTLTHGTAEPLQSVQEMSFASRDDHIRAVVDKLQTRAAASQSEIARLVVLEANGGAVPLFSKTESFWISNQVYFQDATLALVEKLAALPSVSAIAEEEVVPLRRASASTAAVAAENATSVEWGVATVQAPAAWAAGYTGQGIVVGGIDTGARATHEVLAGNFRASYGWFDATNNAAAAYDDDGHGTHTLGTAVGSRGVGVAPGASWIACRACTSSYCTQAAMLACGQFMTCPTDAAGADKDCGKAPHVVNNSWGGTIAPFFYDVIDAWVAAGIVPVFSSGNDGGAGCAILDSPGDHPNAVSVGATTSTDKLGALSSKGPAKNGLVKPDLTAPGINVRSAAITSDTAYKSDQGTSMASRVSSH